MSVSDNVDPNRFTATEILKRNPYDGYRDTTFNCTIGRFDIANSESITYQAPKVTETKLDICHVTVWDSSDNRTFERIFSRSIVMILSSILGALVGGGVSWPELTNRGRFNGHGNTAPAGVRLVRVPEDKFGVHHGRFVINDRAKNE